ncbi:cardiolipin synthase ClsB [Pseudomonas aeruginosa]|nr:cardiolipin synthase ClsB [Pseudomonas aeruginosa]
MNFPWRDGNRVELLINGEEYFPRLFQCIAEARREILLETFIIFEDEVGRQLQEALSAAAERGVEVQVTVDGYGTASLSTDYLARLTAAGVRVHLFDPRPRLLGMRTNLFRRLHRKLVVIDRQQAFVGGINYGEDHLVRRGNMAKQDYAVRVEGPVVRDIRQACLALLEPDADYPPLRPSGAGQPARVRLVIRDNDQSSDDIEREYLQAIRQARRRLLIANAYFFPGYRLLRELRDAARRGVRVDLVLQGMPDMPLVRLCSRLLYDYLLRDDPRYADKAREVAAAARDLVEVLRDEPLESLGLRCDQRLAFHCPCTLQHAQRLGGAVEAVLRRLGFHLTEVADGHLCCGSAGTYSLTQPALSRRLRDNRLDALESGAPDVIATANVGCQAHLDGAGRTPVRHWIELLDQALPGGE